MTEDTDVLAAWRSFQVAHACAHERVEADLRHLGVPGHMAGLDVLLALAAAPDHRLRVGELAPLVVVTRSWLSRVIDRLETDGLVCRTSCPADRRGAFVELTDAGADMVARARPLYERVVREHFGRHVADVTACGRAFAALAAQRRA